VATLSRNNLQCPEQSFSDDVSNFCIENDIASYLGLAVALARETFSSVAKLETRLQHDPDSDSATTRVVIDVTVSDNASKTLVEKKAFTRQWVQLAPAAAREKIRLLYYLL
jgi:hypothetical protein